MLVESDFDTFCGLLGIKDGLKNKMMAEVGLFDDEEALRVWNMPEPGEDAKRNEFIRVLEHVLNQSSLPTPKRQTAMAFTLHINALGFHRPHALSMAQTMKKLDYFGHLSLKQWVTKICDWDLQARQ